MRTDIFEAIDALRQALTDSKASIDYVNDPQPIDDDKRLAISRTAKRLSIAIVALDDIKNALQSNKGGSGR